MHSWMEGTFGHMAGMGFWWIVIVAAVVAFVIWAVRSGGGRARDGGSAPEEFLRERFARGEIDEDEYRERRQAL